MKKKTLLTSLVAIAMSFPALAATDVTFAGKYNNGELDVNVTPGEVDFTYTDSTGEKSVTTADMIDKSGFTYTGTDGNETNMAAGDMPAQSEYTADSSASGVVTGPSQLVSGMTLNKSDYTYKNSADEDVTLGDAPLDVIKTITLNNEAGTEITVTNGVANITLDYSMYKTSTVDGEVVLTEDGLRSLGGSDFSFDKEGDSELAKAYKTLSEAYKTDSERIAGLEQSTLNAYQTEEANFNSANTAFTADTEKVANLNNNFASAQNATNLYNAAIEKQNAALATKDANLALHGEASEIYNRPILETITDGANDAIDGALAQGGAIRSELDVNATAIADNKTAIETNATNIAANSDAISAEKTRAETVEAELDSKIETNTANIAANKTAIETNATNIATNATNIAANKTAIESEVARATAAEAELDGKIALNTAAIEEEVANRIAGDEMTLSAAKAYVDAKNSMSLKSAYDYTDKKVGALEEELSAGIASAAAMSSVAVSNVAKGEVSVGGGYGYYNSQSAVALGAAMGLTDNWSVNAAAGLSDSNVTFRAGTNYKFKLF